MQHDLWLSQFVPRPPDFRHELAASFARGSDVRLTGLLSRPELNGRLGKTQAVEGQRVIVDLEDGACSVKVHPGNLTHIRDPCELDRIAAISSNAPQTPAPLRLWCSCATLVALVRQGTATDATVADPGMALPDARAAQMQLKAGERQAVNAAIIFSVTDLCVLAKYKNEHVHAFTDVWRAWLDVVPEKKWLVLSFGLRPNAASVAVREWPN